MKSTCIVITPVCVESFLRVGHAHQNNTHPRKHKERHCKQLAEEPGNQIYKIPEWNHNRIPFHNVQKDPLPSFRAKFYSFHFRILVSTRFVNQANTYSDQTFKINRLH